MNAPAPEALSDFGIRCPRLTDILSAVRAETNVSVLDILSSRRNNAQVRARQIFCWAARRTTLHSLPEIGRYIGLDHTTVLYAARKIEKLRKADPEILGNTDAILHRVVPNPKEYERRLELVRQRMRG